MYGWEVMPPSMCDYPTWGAFKPEPMDYTVDQKHMKAELSPTSPHSIDSNESSQNNTSFNDHPPQQHTSSTPLYTSVRHQLNLMNPLTPPEYNGQPLNDTSSQPTDTIHSEETNNKLPKSFEPAEILTPRCTPPMNMTPPKTPKYLAESPPENPTDIDLQSFSGDDIMDSDDDLRTPKMNSHGKVKTFKCKQCEFVAVTKLNFWEHTKSHIKPEKMLNCQKCPFVTEYKHHLEYHMRNHDGTKPFRCSQCPYSCVNKSMLNSHLKSHSNIYQFRCGDCNYATKYCHSLKLHLRKYNHKPGLVLNMDGTPNPLPIIDVYGTRRGPKSKSGSRRTSAGKSESFEDEQRFNPEFASDFMYSPTSEKHMPLSPVKSANLHSMLPSLMNNPFANLLNSPAAHNFSAMFPYFNFNIQMLAAQQQAAMAGKLTSSFGSVSQLHSPVDSNQLSDGEDDVFTVTEPMTEEQSTPLNLETNINCVSKTNNNSPVIKSSSPVKKDDITPLVESTTMTVKNKRKGIAFKFDALREEAVESTTSSSDEKPQCDEVATNLDVVSVSQKETQIASIKVEIYECKFCEIVFKDAILHTIHMGYHGFNDVFKCNSCGEKCSDRVSFFLHIARKPHN